ncbi:MAG: hypothetical protein QNK03_08895 [Myxococcota bacterium]|nr:hypothetical protein [Myxococcota bacterium]
MILWLRRLGLVALARWAERLRYPQLFALLVLGFAIALVVPDPIPVLDELLLGLAALAVSRLRRSDEEVGDRASADPHDRAP